MLLWIEFPNGRLWSERKISLGRCVLAHRAKPRAYREWSCSRRQADWEEHRMARRRAQLVYEDAERSFMEQSRSFLTNAATPRKWWPTVKTESLVQPLVCHLSWTGDVS